MPKATGLGADEGDAVVDCYWLVAKQRLGKPQKIELGQVLEFSVGSWQRWSFHAD